MKKWEYLSCNYSLQTIDANFNQLGEQGWEMVSLTKDDSDPNVKFYFKREKVEKVEPVGND